MINEKKKRNQQKYDIFIFSKLFPKQFEILMTILTIDIKGNGQNISFLIN